MIQPYNYSRKFLDYTDYEGWCAAKNEKAITLANVVRQSVIAGTKYMLPPEGDVGIVIKDYQRYINLIRLPYPMVVLEAPLTHWILHENDTYKAPTILSLIKPLDEDLGFSVVPIQFNATHPNDTLSNEWEMAKFAGVMTEANVKSWKGDSKIPEWNVVSMDTDAPVSDLVDSTKLPDNIHFKKFYDRLMHIAVEFVIYANTRNIGVETIHAPPKLNKKRTKRGLKPNYDYKILKIHKTVIRSGGSSTNVGSHKNRWHMVCGHPRWLKGHDQPIWIDPHARGNKELGIIEKAYKI